MILIVGHFWISAKKVAKDIIGRHSYQRDKKLCNKNEAKKLELEKMTLLSLKLDIFLKNKIRSYK